MGLIVEVGTGANSEANSYVSREDAIAYAALRGVVLVDDETTDVMAIKSMDYLSLQAWLGYRTDSDNTDPDNPIVVAQPLDWPRSCVDVGFALVGNNTIPAAIKSAQFQLILAVASGLVLVPTVAGGGAASSKFLTHQKLGPIEQNFSESIALQVNTMPTIPLVQSLLAPYIGGGLNMAYRV